MAKNYSVNYPNRIRKNKHKLPAPWDPGRCVSKLQPQITWCPKEIKHSSAGFFYSLMSIQWSSLNFYRSLVLPFPCIHGYLQVLSITCCKLRFFFKRLTNHLSSPQAPFPLPHPGHPGVCVSKLQVKYDTWREAFLSIKLSEDVELSCCSPFSGTRVNNAALLADLISLLSSGSASPPRPGLPVVAWAGHRTDPRNRSRNGWSVNTAVMGPSVNT
jgi:hypothetical protein